VPEIETSVGGACYCGAVGFEVRLPTLWCGHCHCSMCRRSHGAGFVTWFAVPREGFLLSAGEENLVRFASSDHGTRSFCGRCGSTLFCESSKHPEQVDIVLANMQAAIDRAPQAHIYWSDRADWISADDGLPKLGGETGLEPLA